MRSDPVEYELVAPRTLAAAVSLLAQNPGEWLPIAGGTDVMVQYAAGKLQARKLVSLWNLPELRRIEVSESEVWVGAGCTYTDVREHRTIQQEFPLLASAARWTGGVANQNRGTLGGNIVNASPAADSLPALLVYEAELILHSARGERRVKYVDFHTGYKRTVLDADEVIRTICLSRRFTEYTSYSRKVGARNAQAISKVCVAALGRIAGGAIDHIRIAAGSVAPTPLRLKETERFLLNKPITASVVQESRKIVTAEVGPIDDIRSTSKYRAAVLGNLVAEFLQKLSVEGQSMNTLARWNELSAAQAEGEVLDCCGSRAWARELAARRPLTSEALLVAVSDEIWNGLTAQDWLEAFSKHPRIGEGKVPAAASYKSAEWSAQEQKQAELVEDSVQTVLAQENARYENRFGRVFIVCATGKTAAEMLSILQRRMQNDETTELREAAEEQRKITNLRLKKWLSR
jgi:OHCU decarboxylase